MNIEDVVNCVKPIEALMTEICEKYTQSLEHLGLVLKGTFPSVKWVYDPEPKMWLCYPPDTEIVRTFISKNEGRYWKDILKIDDVICFSDDSDHWVGFSLD